VNNLTEICSELKVALQQLKDSTRVSVAHIKRERNAGDGIDTAPAIQSRSSKKSRVGSTTNVMHSDSKDDWVEAVIQELLYATRWRSGGNYALQGHSWITSQKRNTDTEEVNIHF